jgi:hypothetical protein
VTETITSEEIGYLLGLAAARDQRTVGDADILAWHADLNAARVTLRSAEAALTHYYAVIAPRSDPDRRFRISGPDLLAIIRKARTDRLNSGALVDDGDPDETPQEFVARRRATERAVADGRLGNPAALTAIGLAPANGPQELTEDDIRALQQQKDLGRFIRESLRAGASANTRRKQLVLAHDDLAEQLTQAPIALARADCWSGFMPPERLTDGRVNRSPVRTQLAELVAEAERRAA